MKFICIGKNYIAHAQEMGWDLPKTPMYFFKPENAASKRPGLFVYPKFSKNVHYEIELAVRIHTRVKEASEEEASTCYDAISLGVDFTARDLQKQQKAAGSPWEICKSFDDSAPIGRWIPLAALEKPINDLHFHLLVNGELRQKGYTGDMVFPVERLIRYVSSFVTLDPGDILLTGTPEGIGPVSPGDKLEGFLEEELILSVSVVPSE